MMTGRWSDPRAVCMDQFVEESRSEWMIVMSGELSVSPCIRVGVSSLLVQKSESVIWSARLFPLASAGRAECQSEWCALKSPMIIPSVLSRRCSMFDGVLSVQDDIGGM